MIADAAAPSRLDDTLERLAVFVVATGLGGLALALSGCFVATAALAIGLLSTLLYHLRFPLAPRAAAVPGALRAWHLALALLLALVLRVPTFDAVLGGQDPGVYTHVAAQIVRTGGIAVHDPAWARLGGTPARVAYADDNFVEPFLPGVYTLPGDPPGFVFQFYHLFPVWLAVFGGLFGLGAAGAGLVFLSLASVLFFQRLAHALTGHRGAAIAAGLLLAANPLHAYFSKLPVTEVPTLAFGAMGFAWLARYAQGSAESRRVRWLVLSCVAFACLFLTRISGFMYLPLLFAIGCLARPLDTDPARGAAISRWAFATIGVYALSVLYGLAWSRPYVLKLYSITFVLVGGAHWPWVLAVAVVGAVLVALALRRVRPGGEDVRRLDRYVRTAERWLGPVVVVLLVLGAWRLHRLGFTTAYVGDPSFAPFPGLAGAGWQSVLRGSLVVVALHACPLLFAAYVVLAQRRWGNAGARLMLLFLACFTGYAALLNWYVPYQPYYARYFASELVPCLVLFACCAWAWLDRPRARAWLGAMLAVSGVYFLAWSLAPVGLRDGAGTSAGISRLAAVAGDRDVLLIDAAPGQGILANQLKPALAFVFGRNVVTAGTGVLGDVGVLDALAAAYEDVYLLSAATVAPPGFVRVQSVPLRTMAFPHTALPPVRLSPALDVDMVVYRLDSTAFVPGRSVVIHAAQDGRVHHPVGQRIGGVLQSDGRAGLLLAGPALRLPAGTYVLRLHGGAAGRAAAPDAWLEVVDSASTGASVLARAALHAPDGGGLVAATLFTVAPGAAGIQARVRVSAGSDASVSGYEIARLR